MKKYLNVDVCTHDGRTFNNPLKLSEAHLIGKLAQENKAVTVTFVECTKLRYKLLFG
jgi:hypothetical protein